MMCQTLVPPNICSHYVLRWSREQVCVQPRARDVFAPAREHRSPCSGLGNLASGTSARRSTRHPFPFPSWSPRCGIGCRWRPLSPPRSSCSNGIEGTAREAAGGAAEVVVMAEGCSWDCLACKHRLPCSCDQHPLVESIPPVPDNYSTSPSQFPGSEDVEPPAL
jgi:hypothetical protein